MGVLKNTDGKFISDPPKVMGLTVPIRFELGPPTNELGAYFQGKLPGAVKIMERVGLPPKPPAGTLFAMSKAKDWMKLVDALNAEWAPYINKDIEPQGYTCAAARGKLCIFIVIFEK